VIDIVRELLDYDVKVTIYDPWANKDEVMHEYGVIVENSLPLKKFDGVVLAVAHDEFQSFELEKVVGEKGIVYDVKGVMSIEKVDGRL